jgi:GNAT superfamily N-acetyltransferase
MAIWIKHTDRILHSPALKLAVEGWFYLLQSDMVDLGAVMIAWDHKAFIAYGGIAGDRAEPVGVLTYTDQDWSNTLFVNIAYVIPTWRRQGVHMKMWEAIVEKAKVLQRPMITSSTHINNAISRASMAKQGRKETSVYVRYNVDLSPT